MILKDDIRDFLHEFYTNGKILKGINCSFIALIAKKQCVKSFKDFCLISSIDSIYKIIAKTLANRLKQVMGSLIHPTQSAFVERRQIMDCILIANEVIDSIRKKNRGWTGLQTRLTEKLSICGLGLPTLYYETNGLCGSKQPANLSSAIRRSHNYLLPALGGSTSNDQKDSSMLSDGFGLEVNFKKSALLGIKVDHQLIEEWASKIYCQVDSLPTEYLGIPLGPNPRLSSTWQPIVESVKSKLSLWKCKFLPLQEE
ncbi:uncharacterized protein LOC111283318 [Durio zibethinus]|uniref:Uncharacterized protein LOC111283318 n=1 Tax=Durio zibethinus TaxID=66656 RepID=A0A6P5XGX2_DURZI|nr:uncharacterized protein LOC111283318 [Durio zibethinus]